MSPTTFRSLQLIKKKCFFVLRIVSMGFKNHLIFDENLCPPHKSLPLDLTPVTSSSRKSFLLKSHGLIKPTLVTRLTRTIIRR